MNDKLAVSIESFVARPSTLKLEDGAELTLIPTVVKVVREPDTDANGVPVYTVSHRMQIEMWRKPNPPHPSPKLAIVSDFVEKGV